MSDHSILSPSSAHAWVKCSGYVLMSQAFPELEDTPESMEGSAAHWAAEQLIRGRLSGTCATPSPAAVEGLQAPNGVVITDEMAEAACVYAVHFLDRAVAARIFGGPLIRIEDRVACPDIHESCFGTPDAVLYDKQNATLDIWDFKYGHLWVSEFENWQMLAYYAGLRDHYGIDGLADQYVSVRMHVIQPRAYGGPGGPCRTWELKGVDLRAYVNALTAAAHEATGSNPQFTAGKHCRDCPGRHACPALRESALVAYDASTSPLPDYLTPEQSGVMLLTVRQAIKRLEAIEVGLSSQIESHIRAGVAVPGFAVEPVATRPRWNAPSDQIIATGTMLGVDLSAPGVVTPSVAVKLGVPEDVVKALTYKPNGGVKIVEDKNQKTKRLFS